MMGEQESNKHSVLFYLILVIGFFLVVSIIQFNGTTNLILASNKNDTLQSITDRGSVTTNNITAGQLNISRNILGNVGVFVRNDELTGNAGFSYSNQGSTEKSLSGLAYGRNTTGSIGGYPRSELSRIWAVNSHLVLDTFVNDNITYDIALSVKGDPSLIVYGDTGDIEVTKNLFVNGLIEPLNGYRSSDGSTGATGDIIIASTTTINVKNGLIVGWS